MIIDHKNYVLVQLFRIVSHFESRLISFGFFKIALIVRVLTNTVILVFYDLNIMAFKNKKLIKSRVLKFEIKVILYESLGLKSRLKKLNLFPDSVTFGTQKYINLNFQDRHEFKKILIIGPSKLTKITTANPDLIILLNPDLTNLNLDDKLNYIIVLNKNMSRTFTQEIINLTNKSCILQILIKGNSQLLMNYDKVHAYNMQYVNSFSIKGNGLNLLPISLLFIQNLEPELVEIIGCDFYLTSSKYFDRISIGKSEKNTSSEISKREFLNKLSFHNPYDQLTIYKLTTFWLKSRDCIVTFDFDSISYWQMAVLLNKSFKLKYF